MSTINILQVFKDCSQTLLHAILELPILIFTECNGTEAFLVWLAHLREIQWIVISIHDCFHFHCQAVCFDLVYSTAVMDIDCTLFYRETHPAWSLVTKPSAYISDILLSVHYFFFQ